MLIGSIVLTLSLLCEASNLVPSYLFTDVGWATAIKYVCPAFSNLVQYQNTKTSYPANWNISSPACSVWLLFWRALNSVRLSSITAMYWKGLNLRQQALISETGYYTLLYLPHTAQFSTRNYQYLQLSRYNSYTSRTLELEWKRKTSLHLLGKTDFLQLFITHLPTICQTWNKLK